MATARDIPIRVLVSPETADALDAYAVRKGVTRQYLAATLLEVIAQKLAGGKLAGQGAVLSRTGAA